MSISPADGPRVSVKLLLLGEASVGKSSLMLRYTDGKFYENRLATIGIENKNVALNFADKIVNLQIWDTAGQEKWKHVPSNYYRNVNGIIVVYDISYHQSFVKVSDWMGKIAENTTMEKLSLILVGNKADLDREVTQLDAQQFAQEHNMLFLETSAKTNKNVESLFMMITKDVLAKSQPRNNAETLSITAQKKNQKKEPNCC